MLRRTKIVATLGPSTDDPQLLERLIMEGVNVVRLNFSHGSVEDHRQRARWVRDIARRNGRTVAILGDLQGPKIRIARFADGSVTLNEGDSFDLDMHRDNNAGDSQGVGIDYPQLADDVKSGDRLLLDDGRVILRVQSIEQGCINTLVEVGGSLSNNKGINREGGGLSAAALTKKDRDDIALAAEIGVDYLAVSFVRCADDLHQARELLQEAGGNAGMVAKIERAEVVNCEQTLDAVIKAADVVMVARGDLGVEIGDAELIAVQKHIIRRARVLGRASITATQMMESMITSLLPTRAEVFDVANAVLDGTDAVMLSGETAAGDFPVQVVEAMQRIILGAEKQPETRVSGHRLHESFSHVDETIAMAVMYTANHLSGIKAIISLTETGNTPLLMSRISSDIPVFAFTRHDVTKNRVALYRGVVPVTFDIASLAEGLIDRSLVDELKRRGIVEEGDYVVISKGDKVHDPKGTNTMKIVRVTGLSAEGIAA